MFARPSRGRRAPPAAVARLLAATLLVAAAHLATLAAGQGADLTRAPGGEVTVRLEGIWRLVAAADLARALGAPFDADDRVLTLRSRGGVLTVFAEEPDASWHPAGASQAEAIASATPVRRIDGAWYLPEDLLGVLGARLDDDVLVVPGGTARALTVVREAPRTTAVRAEVIDLGPGVEALRLYADSPSGPASVSLLAVDLGLLALAFPEQREALDAQVRALHADKALFLVVTSLGPAVWDPALYVLQDDVEVLLRAPLAVQVLAGDPASLRPDAPVAAVAFLPSHLDLRRPLLLRWAGANGSLTLRR